MATFSRIFPMILTNLDMMQKESPERGWQHGARSQCAIPIRHEMQKESPKRGWQPILDHSGPHVRGGIRCKKNHPEGDGNKGLSIWF